MPALALMLALGPMAAPALAAEVAGVDNLSAVYPDIEAIAGNEVVWKDQTRMKIDDFRAKSAADWLDNPDIEDMFRYPYPAGAPAAPPAKDVDPGRARHAGFFNKMYGDCRKGEVTKRLAEVVWLPKRTGQRLMVTTVNGVNEKLAKVSAEIEAALGDSKYDRYLVPAAGTYNCRTIAGTDRMSAHGHGIAIDIAVKHSHYWRNARPAADGSYAYMNDIPMEIVAIFEKHGFIWGGRWHHYDTMHFEFRPELFSPPAKAVGNAGSGD